MIDKQGFRLVYLTSAVLFIVAASIALAVWGGVAILAGLAVGYGLGLLPLASWQWTMGRLLTGGGRVAWGISLLVLKLALYGAVLFFLISSGRVNGIAAGVGLTLIPLVLPVVFLARPAATEQGV